MNLRDFLAARAEKSKQQPKATAANNDLLRQMDAVDAALNSNAVKPAAPISQPKGPKLNEHGLLEEYL